MVIQSHYYANIEDFNKTNRFNDLIQMLDEITYP